MPELESVTVRGFKSISVIENLKLSRINVLIGPNGSGKSNFIGVFSFLQAIRSGRLQEYVATAGGAERILHFGSKVSDTIRIHIEFTAGVNQYEIVLGPSESDELVPLREAVYFWNKQHPRPYERSISRVGKEAGISANKPEEPKISTYVQNHLDSWRLYHFHDTSSSSPMKKTADINDNRFLRPNGSNLASFLFLLKQKHIEEYELIRRTIQCVAPFFDDFILEPQRLNSDKVRLEWRHKESPAYFDAASLSDGTLRFIALTTLFLQPNSLLPSVILVDEPELGLHPYAIAMLASVVKQVHPQKQVILSTQSSILLDHFDPEDVLVADRVDGATQFKPLDATKLIDWLEDYSLGQLWEKNELGGRPSRD